MGRAAELRRWMKNAFNVGRGQEFWDTNANTVKRIIAVCTVCLKSIVAMWTS